MAIHFVEFDTTVGGLINDLKTQILVNTDWSYQGFGSAIATTSANASANASSLNFASGTIPAAVVPGSRIRVDSYASGIAEWREVTTVTATSIGVSPNLTYAHTSGTSVFWGNEVFKTTTTRGANMIFDLTGSNPTNYRLGISAYNGWTEPTGTVAGAYSQGAANKYVHWRNGTSNLNYSSSLHVTLSSSKDHIFISIEGPRGSETGAENSAYGSPRNYFFMADMVPYSVSDTIPTVICGGSYSDSNTSTVANKSYAVSISKNLAGTVYWADGRLLALNFPAAHTTDAAGAQRFTVADDEYYLSPYVVASDAEGFRGRLNKLFFAGFNSSDSPDGLYPISGAEVDYDGVTYRLTQVTKSNGSHRNWGPFGSVENGSAATFWRSPIVAIPIA